MNYKLSLYFKLNLLMYKKNKKKNKILKDVYLIKFLIPLSVISLLLYKLRYIKLTKFLILLLFYLYNRYNLNYIF